MIRFVLSLCVLINTHLLRINADPPEGGDRPADRRPRHQGRLRPRESDRGPAVTRGVGGG